MKVTEEILLTLGVDYKNVVSGLQRAGSYIAGWGTSLAHTVKSQFFHALAAERVFEYLIQGAEAVSERIVAIKRVSEELGASTNMVQGLFIAAEKKGLDKEAIVRPLIRLSALLGEAKDGSVKARQELVQYGIATKETNWQTMRFADALSSLQQRFKTLNTEQQNSMLKQLIGVKGASSVRSILEGSDVRKMDEGSVFKISPENLRFYQELFAAQKENKGSALGLAGNAILSSMRASIGGLILHKLLGEKNVESEIADAAETTVENKIKQLDIEKQLLELATKKEQIESQINDRNKSTVSQMATSARHILGVRAPEIHTVTGRMRQAMNIDTIERRAGLAFLRGNDALHDRLTAQADQMRANAGFLKYEDSGKNLKRAVDELAIVTEQLKPVQEAAELFTSKLGN